MSYLFAIVGVVVLGNFYFLYSRNKKNRKSAKTIKDEQMATMKRHHDMKNRLAHEHEDAERRVELRNKTLEMYHQVRTDYAEDTLNDQ